MKVDFKKNIDSYKAKHGQFSVIDVPVMQYLMIDGHNGPAASSDFAAVAKFNINPVMPFLIYHTIFQTIQFTLAGIALGLIFKDRH